MKGKFDTRKNKFKLNIPTISQQSKKPRKLTIIGTTDGKFFSSDQSSAGSRTKASKNNCINVQCDSPSGGPQKSGVHIVTTVETSNPPRSNETSQILTPDNNRSCLKTATTSRGNNLRRTQQFSNKVNTIDNLVQSKSSATVAHTTRVRMSSKIQTQRELRESLITRRLQRNNLMKTNEMNTRTPIDDG